MKKRFENIDESKLDAAAGAAAMKQNEPAQDQASTPVHVKNVPVALQNKLKELGEPIAPYMRRALRMQMQRDGYL